MSRLTVSVMVGVVAAVAMLSVGMRTVAGQVGRLACAEVVEELSPCISYLKGYRRNPSKECCDGVAQLFDDNDSESDWDSTCWCIKKTLHAVWRYDPSRISRLPRKCDVPDDDTESDDNTESEDDTESEDEDVDENENDSDDDSDSDSDNDNDNDSDNDSDSDSDSDDGVRAGDTESGTESDTDDDTESDDDDDDDDRFNCFRLTEEDKVTLGLKE